MPLARVVQNVAGLAELVRAESVCKRSFLNYAQRVCARSEAYDRGGHRPADNSAGLDLRRDEKPFVDVVAEALGLKKLRVIETGGNAYMRERTQWDSGANLVCASPGVVFAYDRNTYTNTFRNHCASNISTCKVVTVTPIL